MRIRECLSASLIVVAAAVGVGLVGCGSSSSSPGAAGSAAGQSCTKTADCASNLVCISNTCFLAAGTTTSVDGGGQDSSTSADGSTTVTPQTGPEQLGQACAASADCAAGLTCVPFSSAVGGLCDYASFGVSPDAGTTGKVCGGECVTASDCCELPPPGYSESATLYSYSDAGAYLGGPGVTVYADQCAAILQGLGGSTAACSSLSPSNPNNAATSRLCYYYQTYCASTCATNWSCNNNACVYTAGCTVGATSESSGACAYYSRTGRQLGATCTATTDAGTAGSCAAAATTCTTSASCNGLAIADPQVVENQGTICAGGDCSCVQNKCYFSCAQDIDCAGGYSCNATSHLCTKATPTGCMTNNDCVTVSVAGMGADAKAICNTTTHACAVPCTTDHDCSLSSGAVPSLGRFSGYVCSAGYCTTVSNSAGSCSTNADCQGMAAGAVNTFCIASSAPAVTESAISGGKGMKLQEERPHHPCRRPPPAPRSIRPRHQEPDLAAAPRGRPARSYRQRKRVLVHGDVLLCTGDRVGGARLWRWAAACSGQGDGSRQRRSAGGGALALL